MTDWRSWACACLLATASAAAAAQTPQERFDAAQQAFDAENWDAAASGFEGALAALPEAERQSAVAAILLSRAGEAHARAGRTTDAMRNLLQAEALFGPEASGEDARATFLQLGQGFERGGQIEEAAARYERALALSADQSPYNSAALGLARTLTFSDGDRAAELVEQAAKAVAADMSIDPERRTELGTELALLRARIALNSEGPEHAVEYYSRALSDTGTYGRRVTPNDVRVRSEAAFADFLAGDPKRAHHKMQHAGLGTEAKSLLPIPAALSLPDCAPRGPVRPDDMMIVEFAVSADGEVMGLTPIYSSRPGEIETAFLSELAETRWSPSTAAEVDPFWRLLHRAEVRCGTSRDTIDPRSQFLPLFEDLSSASEAIQTPGSDERAALLERLDWARENWQEQPQEALLHIWRASGLSALLRENDELAALAARTAEAAGWTDAKTALLWSVIALPGYLDRDMLSEMSARVASDPSREAVAARVMTSILAGRVEEMRDRERSAIAHYEDVLREDLPGGSQAMQFANLRLASLSYELDREDRAEGYLEASGLASDQCSLLDASPTMERYGLGPDDFPLELMRKGYQGKLLASYDISTEGRVLEPRIVYATPPLIFNEAITENVRKMRYNRIYRKGESIGCIGQTQAFQFKFGY